MENQEINKYIYGLKYDPRVLLSVPGENETVSIPLKSKTRTGVIICTSKKQEVNNSVKELTILSPSAGTIYPGALIGGDEQLALGKPKSLSVKRAPISVSTDLPGSGSVLVESPSYASVKSAVEALVADWLKKKEAGKIDHTARLSYIVTKAYSKGQLWSKLGLRSEWANNEIQNSLEVTNNQSQSTAVALFKQVFFTTTYDIPDSPSAIFDNTVTVENLKNIMSETCPPAYVKSVDFGRIILVRMTTSSNETKTDMENTLKMVTGQGAKIDAEAKNRYSKISENSSFEVLILGGGAKISSKIFSGANEIEEIKPLIISGIQLSEDNPGYPVSYTVNYLRDNALATMNLTSTYYETECVQYYDGFVKVHNDSACVANFQVTWDELKDDGTKAAHSYNSKDRNKGFQETIHLPGDATNIRIIGKAAKFIKTWQTVIDTILQGPTCKTYTIKGSAFKLTQKIE